MNGGKQGRGPEISITFPDGAVEHGLKMRARPLPTDTVIECQTGGGGNGAPDDRPFDAVMQDVRQGLVSREAAADDYGVVIRDDGTVDQAASVAR